MQTPMKICELHPEFPGQVMTNNKLYISTPEIFRQFQSLNALPDFSTHVPFMP